MTDNDTLQTRQAIAAKDRSGRMTVTGKLKVALDLMLFDGSRRDDAAKAAGMTIHGLREAFKKPHVKAYYNHGLVVLRESERARNIKRLTEIRDKADNMPAVQAIKELELTPEQARAGQHGGPRAGWAIDLSEQQAGVIIHIHHPPQPMIDVTPIEDEDSQADPPSPPFKSPKRGKAGEWIRGIEPDRSNSPAIARPVGGPCIRRTRQRRPCVFPVGRCSLPKQRKNESMTRTAPPGPVLPLDHPLNPINRGRGQN
jgi:hypothetical protein